MSQNIIVEDIDEANAKIKVLEQTIDSLKQKDNEATAKIETLNKTVNSLKTQLATALAGYGTTDLTASSTLATGKLYVVYQ